MKRLFLVVLSSISLLSVARAEDREMHSEGAMQSGDAMSSQHDGMKAPDGMGHGGSMAAEPRASPGMAKPDEKDRNDTSRRDDSMNSPASTKGDSGMQHGG
jgi:hypothetical protein